MLLRVQRNCIGQAAVALGFWPTGMASGQPKWWICAGSKSTSKWPSYTSGGPRTARRPRISSAAVRSASSGGISGKAPPPLSCSSRSVERHYQRRAFPAWSSGQLRWPSWASRPMRTCCVMPAAISLPMMATIPGRSRPTLGIAIFRTPLAIQRRRRSGSRSSFAIDRPRCWPRKRKARPGRRGLSRLPAKGARVT
jgi:hypothetical protein